MLSCFFGIVITFFFVDIILTTIYRDALTTASQLMLSPENTLEKLCSAFKAIDGTPYKKACLEIKKLERKKTLTENERWTRDSDEFKNVHKTIIERARDDAKSKLRVIITGHTILRDILHRSGKLGKENTSFSFILL